MARGTIFSWDPGGYHEETEDLAVRAGLWVWQKKSQRRCNCIFLLFSFIFEPLNQFQGRAVCGEVRWESVNPWAISFPAFTAHKITAFARVEL